MWLILALAACGTTPPAEPNKEAPAAVEPPTAPVAAEVLKTDAGDVQIFPGVHGTFRLQAGDKSVWVDPWSKSDLTGPKADLVLVTDTHFDHLDVEAIKAVIKPETVLVAPKAVVDELAKTPVDGITVRTLNNQETTEAAGIPIEAVPMYNLVRGPEEGKLFHDKGRGNGYILLFGQRRIYIAGDTECTPEMKALQAIDVAFVPMNLPYTMTPEEAAECIAAFKPGVVIPYHYTDSDLTKLDAPLAAAGVPVKKFNWYPNGLPF